MMRNQPNMNKIKLRLHLINQCKEALDLGEYELEIRVKDINYYTNLTFKEDNTFVVYFWRFLCLNHRKYVDPTPLSFRGGHIPLKFFKEFRDKLMYTSCEGIL